MSKWHWFVKNLKQIVKNLFIRNPKCIYWMITYEELQKYQNIEKDYLRIKAERDMWYNIAQVNSEKFNSIVNWVNANWGGVQNEK